MASKAFGELGLRAELADAAAAAGFEDPTTLQRAAIPVIRRGANAVLRGASGSGVTAAYVLPVLDRLAGGDREGNPRVLVLAASPERASETAATFSRLAGATGLRARAIAPAWPRVDADIVVATAEAVLRSVGDSSLKLDALQTFVLDDAAGVLALDTLARLEELLVTVPAEAQRVVTTSGMTKDVERFVTAHVRRAMEIPARPADPVVAATSLARGTVSYRVVPQHEKEEALAELLARTSEQQRVVITRTNARAEALRASLTARGFDVSTDGASGSISVMAALDAPRATFAYDVPADPQVMERMEPDSGVVLVTPRELRHLRALAAEAGFELEALSTRPRKGPVIAFRDRIRRALREEDLDAQLMLLEPLFEEFSAAEVAAALSALLRARRAEQAAAQTAAQEDASAAPPSFVRLFVGVGQRDNVRPNDIVGAITGEASVKGEQVGRIDIRDSFSVVEVDASVADRVIRALNGTTMRGRGLRVDYDRKTSTAPRRARVPPTQRGGRPTG